MKKITLFFTALFLSLSVSSFAAKAIVVNSVEELKANAGKTVIFKSAEIKARNIGDMFYYYLSDNRTEVDFKVDLIIPPYKADLLGIFNSYTEKFEVKEILKYVGFKHFGELRDFASSSLTTDKQKNAFYEIQDKASVIYVIDSAAFVYYHTPAPLLAVVHFPAEFAGKVKIGDELSGMQVRYNPMAGELNESFTATTFVNTHVDNFDVGYPICDINTLTNVEELQHFASFALTNGYLVKDGKDYFYENEDGSLAIPVYVPADYDVTPFLDIKSDFAMVGVADYYYFGTVRFMLTEFRDPAKHYSSLLEWIMSSSMSINVAKLDCPVFVNHIFETAVAKYVFIEDSTAAVAMALNKYQEIDFVPGDSIVGVKGIMAVHAGEKAPIISADESAEVTEITLTKVGKGEIKPIDATIADLVADRDYVFNYAEIALDYANKVVRLKNVLLDDSKDKKNPYLIQDGDTLQFNAYRWKNFKTYPKMNIVAVVDFGVLSSGFCSYTIQPLNAESIQDADAAPTAVEDAELNYAVYPYDSDIIVEAEAGALIEVYSLQGQRLYSSEAVSEFTVVGGINADFVIVRVNNEIHKIILK